MNRFAEAQAADKLAVRQQCWRIQLDPSLTTKQRRELDVAIADPTITATIIAHVVKNEWGIHIEAQSIRRHRKGECRCPR